MAEKQRLVGLWGHSHEEDRGGVEVYRPEGFAFPLARGREWIELRADGTAAFFGAGADDRAVQSAGRWRSAGEAGLELTRPSGSSRRFTIIEAGADVLKLRRDDP